MSPISSLILRVGVAVEFHTILVFSLFLLFAGHNQPGGGFVGGLVGGAALVLRYLDGGLEELRATTRVPAHVLLGVGLVVAVITGLVPLLLGAAFLESALVSVEVPVLGTVKTTSSLPFDVGVYLVVLGLVIGLLEILGSEQQPVEEAEQ